MSKEEVVKRYLKWYSDHFEDINRREEEANINLTKFLDKFGTEHKLRSMDMRKDYAFQTLGSKDTFCYLIDFGTDNLGVNRCAAQSGYQRYGIQLTKDGKWLPFSKNTTNDKECEKLARERFDGYLEKTVDLLNATNNNDNERINSIKLPSPHLNKLHFIFSKGKTISIFVHPALNKLFDLFEIKESKNKTVFEKREILLNYMNETFKEIDITPWRFCDFIYNGNGLRSLWKPIKFIIKTLEKNIQEKPLNLNVKVEKSSEESGINVENDGSKAEDLFYECLCTKKEEFGIEDINKIRRIHSNPETGIHCDFAYETKDGKTMYVEVKSSNTESKNKLRFFMSDYEYKFMEDNKANYLLYYLPNAQKNKKIFYKITPEQIKQLSRPLKYIIDC